MDKLLELIESFRALQPGWDSYEGQPITAKAIEAALAFVAGLTVLPMADGGIQIESGDVSVNVFPDGKISVDHE